MRMNAAFIRVGLSACDMGTSYFLPRLVPPTKAMELMITGRIFLAEEADELGLLNSLLQTHPRSTARGRLAHTT